MHIRSLITSASAAVLLSGVYLTALTFFTQYSFVHMITVALPHILSLIISATFFIYVLRHDMYRTKHLLVYGLAAFLLASLLSVLSGIYVGTLPQYVAVFNMMAPILITFGMYLILRTTLSL